MQYPYYPVLLFGFLQQFRVPVGARLLVALLLVLPLSSRAQVELGRWRFSSNTCANPQRAASSVLAGLEFSEFTLGAGLNCENQNNRQRAENWPTSSTWNNDDYYSFTITAEPCSTLELDNLQFTEYRNGDGPTKVMVVFSVDGGTFSPPLVEWNPPTSTGTRTIDLSSRTDLQDLRAQEVEFRLYGADAGSSGGIYVVDNVRFNGVVNAEDDSPPLANSTVPVCANQTATVSVVPCGTSVIDWYAQPSGGSPLATGANSYTTGPLSDDDTLWAQALAPSPGTYVASIRKPVPVSVVTDLGNNTITNTGLVSYCGSDDPSVLSGSLPTGGSNDFDGDYTYLWEYRGPSAGSFSPAPGTNDQQDYDPGPLGASGVHRFRRVVNDNWAPCSPAITSSEISITVFPDISNNTISYGAATDVCLNHVPGQITGQTPTGSDGNFSYQWEYNPPSGGWQNAPGASTQLSYTPPTLNQAGTWRFRRVVNSGCVASTSGVVTFEVYDVNLSANITNSSGANDGAIDLSVSGGQAPYTYSWTSAPNISVSSQDQSGLDFGTYTVAVTDNLGCTANASYTVSNVGVLNTYAAVDSIVMDESKVVLDPATLRGAGSGSTIGSRFSSGDLVLLVQMQGAEINTAAGSGFGNLNNANDAGQYEYALVADVNGDTLQLYCPPSNTYASNSTYAEAGVQVVRVISRDNLILNNTLTAEAWNGETGGVLALDVENLVLNAGVDVSGLGFRGGEERPPQSCPSGGCGRPANRCTGTDWVTDFPGDALTTQKGEGVAGRIGNQDGGKARNANGGGGGGNGAGGGAGGSNYGAAGRGGDCGNNNACLFGCNRSDVAGQPGIALNGSGYSAANNRVFAGGGGGGGNNGNSAQYFNAPNATGMPGGGLAFIRSDNLTANSVTLNASGQDGFLNGSGAIGNGVGGGGGGGAVLLQYNNLSGTGLTVDVRGGRGTDSRGQCSSCGTGSYGGPGGGGGGGVVWVSAANTSGITTQTAGGGAGISYNFSGGSPGGSHGANNGDSGADLTNWTAPGVELGAGYALNVLSGSYTVGGATPDYATLDAFLADLDTSYLADTVTVRLRAGTYTGNFVIPQFNSLCENQPGALLIQPDGAATVVLSNSTDYALEIDAQAGPVEIGDAGGSLAIERDQTATPPSLSWDPAVRVDGNAGEIQFNGVDILGSLVFEAGDSTFSLDHNFSLEQGDLQIANTVLLNTGVSLDLTDANLVVNNSGSFTVQGTLATAYFSLINSSGVLNLAASGSMEVEELLVAAGGQVAQNGPLTITDQLTLNNTGLWSGDGQLTFAGNDVTFGGSWNSTSATLHDVELSQTDTLLLESDLYLSGNLTRSSGRVDAVRNGTAIHFVGSEAQTLAAGFLQANQASLHGLTLDNGTGGVTLLGDLDLSGPLTMGGEFDPGAHTVTLLGDDQTTAQEVGGAWDSTTAYLNNLTITNGQNGAQGVQLTSDIYLAGDLSLGADAEFAPNGNSVTFFGASNHTLSGDWNTDTSYLYGLVHGGSGELIINVDLDIAGDWNQQGLLQQGANSRIRLNGASQQLLEGVLTGASAPTCLELDNPAGVQLGSGVDLEIDSLLILTQGVLDANGNTVHLLRAQPDALQGYPAGSSLAASGGYISGELQRNLGPDGDYTFPVGTPLLYRRLDLTTNSLLGASSLTVHFNLANATAANYSTLSHSGGSFTDWLGGGYWTLNPDQEPTGGDYALQVWTPGLSIPQLREAYDLVKRDNSSSPWYFPVPTPAADFAQNLAGNTWARARRTGLTSFSDVAQVGSPDDPLAVELIDFSAQPHADKVDLHWRTASEINSDYFLVQRSKNLQTFQNLHSLPAAGVSNQELHYSYTDWSPLDGRSYYRLQQVDFDGTVHTLQPLEVLRGPELLEREVDWRVFPNPVQRGRELSLELVSPVGTTARVEVYNALGQLLFQTLRPLNANEAANLELSTSGWAAGAYNLVLQLNGQSYTTRLVVNN